MNWTSLARRIQTIGRLHEKRSHLVERLRNATQSERWKSLQIREVRAQLREVRAQLREVRDRRLAVSRQRDLLQAKEPYVRLRSQLDQRGIDLVLDVGANTGQYGRILRARGFTGEIISFEPLTDAFADLLKTCSEDKDWSGYRYGLGERDGESTINVSANSVSSSFLPARNWATEVAAGIAAIGQETVPVRRLDTLVPELTKATRIFLKIDAQGFERPVLEGATGLLDRIEMVQLELPLKSAYEGQYEIGEMIGFMGERELEPVLLWPGWTDATGFLREVDMVFARPLKC